MNNIPVFNYYVGVRASPQPTGLLTTLTAVRGLRILSNGNLEIDRGKWQAATLIAEQFIHPQLTIIRCKTETSRRAIAIIIAPDMLDAERFRALRRISS